LHVPCGGVNGLPNTDNVLGEVYVADSERESLTDPQSQNRRNGKDRAEWFWGSRDDLSHLLVAPHSARTFCDSRVCSDSGRPCQREEPPHPQLAEQRHDKSKQIEVWHSECPDANTGVVVNGVVMLDDDGGDLKEKYEAETGKKFPSQTFTVMTSTKPTGLLGCHYYFHYLQSTVETHSIGQSQTRRGIRLSVRVQTSGAE
jgi:Bifunctional DNA primase/polymerase, N-terminal